MAEPMYIVLTAPTMLCFHANVQYCINNISPFYFTMAPMLPESYHNTGPQGIFLCHLVYHGTLSNPDNEPHLKSRHENKMAVIVGGL